LTVKGFSMNFPDNFPQKCFQIFFKKVCEIFLKKVCEIFIKKVCEIFLKKVCEIFLKKVHKIFLKTKTGDHKFKSLSEKVRALAKFFANNRISKPRGLLYFHYNPLCFIVFFAQHIYVCARCFQCLEA
jgi:protein gp37